MKPATLWLNKNLSSTFNVIEILRAAAGPTELRIICSHTSPEFPAGRISDEFVVEPKGLSETDYVAYCLDFARRRAVDVFVPGRNLRAIVRQRTQFEAAGVRLIAAADADTLRLLENKARFYAALGPDLVPVPAYRVVHDLAGFDAACAELGPRYGKLCFKPAVSMFGLGFRILTEGGDALERLFAGDVLHIARDEARRLLGSRPSFRDLLVMQYLPGPERSVDCLARAGELICCVVRLKPAEENRGQLLEDNPAVEDLVRRLTARLRLDGLFNVQFRDSDGVPYLLEINPRMSGGLHLACASGVALPYWAVRLALGTAVPADVPRPRTGLRVGKVDRAVPL